MPIKGWSDKIRLTRLGKIRLGIKAEAPSGALYPKQVDYFVVNEDAATSADAAASFHHVYGAEPRELDIAFPTEDPEEWAGQWLRMYSRTWGLICRGDGETATAKIDPATGTWVSRDSQDSVLKEIPGCGESCPNFQSKPPRCRPVMSLQMILPHVRGLGLWQIDTSSFHSIRNINSQVKLIQALVGRISLIPLKLRIVPLKVQPAGQPSKTVHVLDLQISVTLAELQRSAAAIPAPQVVLPAAADEEEPEDLAEEHEEGGEAHEPEAEASGLRARLLAPDAEVCVEPENGAAPHMEKRGDLFNACLKRWGDTSRDVARVLGYSSPDAIAENHLDDAWQQMVYHHEMKGGEENAGDPPAE